MQNYQFAAVIARYANISRRLNVQVARRSREKFGGQIISTAVCPIYDCVVNEKKLENCGVCSEIPCKTWQDLKDPSYTDEQHEASIKTRVENLRKLKK